MQYGIEMVPQHERCLLELQGIRAFGGFRDAVEGRRDVQRTVPAVDRSNYVEAFDSELESGAKLLGCKRGCIRVKSAPDAFLVSPKESHVLNGISAQARCRGIRDLTDHS